MPIVHTKPQVEIYQQFQTLPTIVTDPMRALIIGPNYYLCRFEEADEKAYGLLGSYDKNFDTEYTWPNKPAGGVVDQDWTKLIIEDALLRYFLDEIGSGSTILVVSGEPNKIRASSVVWRTANGVDRSDALQERDVQRGDVVKVRAIVDSQEFITWATVAGFEYETTDATLSSATADDANQAATIVAGAVVIDATNITGTASGAAYDGLADGQVEEQYTLTCTQGMTGDNLEAATFRIVSASGTDDDAEFSFTSGFGVAHDIGTRGASVTLNGDATSELEIGDTVTVTVSQLYTVPTITGNADNYTGTVDRTYIVNVVGINDDDNPIVTVTTTTGNDHSGPQEVVLTEATAIGHYGVTVTWDTVPCPGDKFYLVAAAEASGACQTLVLSRTLDTEVVTGDADGSSSAGDGTVDLEVSLYIKKTLVFEYGDTDAFETSADEITVKAGIMATDSSWTNGGVVEELPVIAGTAYTEFRALLPTYADSREVLDSFEDIEDTLGPVSPDNPLALGVYMAMLNSSGVEIGFIAVGSDNTSGYTTALSRIENNDACYNIVPLSQSLAVQAAVKSHVLAQSAADVGFWRICWLNSESDQTSVVVDEDEDGETLVATISEDAVTGEFLYVDIDDESFADVEVGDAVRTNFVGEDYDEYIVDEVTSDDRLKLLSGPSAAISVAQKIEVWRTRTSREEATDYGALSTAFNDRRVRHIWPSEIDIPTDGDDETVPGYYLCAALAGLKSASAPHQPLSFAELTGIAAVPRSLEDMSESDLDVMAAAGTWVVTSDQTGGTIYTRLAVTTDVQDINHSQDHRTSNVDSLSFSFNARLSEMVGRYNVTDEILELLEQEVDTMLEWFSSNTITPLLGPQLISGTQLVPPEQDSTLLDTINVVLSLEVPYELDNIKMTLLVA